MRFEFPVAGPGISGKFNTSLTGRSKTMLLTRQTDYGLRMLIYLALHPERRATALEIADAFQISQNHLLKLIQRLAGAGVVNTYRGKGGGVALASPPKDIRVGDVVRELEHGLEVIDCNRPLCPIAPACDLREVLAGARDAFLAVLDDCTLEDVVHRRRDTLRLLVSSHESGMGDDR